MAGFWKSNSTVKASNRRKKRRKHGFAGGYRRWRLQQHMGVERYWHRIQVPLLKFRFKTNPFLPLYRSTSGELALYELAAIDADYLPQLRDDRQSMGTRLHEEPTCLSVPSYVGHLQRDTSHLQHVALLRGNVDNLSDSKLRTQFCYKLVFK